MPKLPVIAILFSIFLLSSMSVRAAQVFPQQDGPMLLPIQEEVLPPQQFKQITFEDVVGHHSNQYTLDHIVVEGDTIGKIAKQYGTTIELIKKRNQLNEDMIRLGWELSIWVGIFTIEISKEQNLLYLKLENHVLKSYPIATGKPETSTPVGEYSVMTRLIDPDWHHKGELIKAGDPANPLGTRWLGFDERGYGIHGTINPDQIGQSVSSGCIRMHNHHVEELFSLIPLGSKIVIK